MAASWTPCDRSPTGSFSGQRVAAMRARSASISASGVAGIVNGRIAVVPAELSVGTDMRVSLVALVVDAELAAQDGAGPSGVVRRVEDELMRSPVNGWYCL